MRDLASPEEVALLRDAGGPLVLPLENPWSTGKTIFVCAGADALQMRASRAENVVLVGENSRGCLGFGNAGLHQLPHSRLEVSLPINFGRFPTWCFVRVWAWRRIYGCRRRTRSMPP